MSRSLELAVDSAYVMVVRNGGSSGVSGMGGGSSIISSSSTRIATISLTTKRITASLLILDPGLPEQKPLGTP